MKMKMRGCVGTHFKFGIRSARAVFAGLEARPRRLTHSTTSQMSRPGIGRWTGARIGPSWPESGPPGGRLIDSKLLKKVVSAGTACDVHRPSQLSSLRSREFGHSFK